MPAVLGRDPGAVAVALRPRGEHAVEGVAIEGLADAELRGVDHVELADGQRRLLGHEALGRRPPAAADHVLEERVDGVERAAFGVAGQHQVVAHRLHDDPVVAERIEFHVGHELRQPLARADDDLLPLGGHLALGQDLQLRAGHLLQVRLQLVGGGRLDGGGLVGHGNHVVRLAVPGQHQPVVGNGQRNGGQKSERERQKGISWQGSLWGANRRGPQ